jgi:hypothetical protein
MVGWMVSWLVWLVGWLVIAPFCYRLPEILALIANGEIITYLLQHKVAEVLVTQTYSMFYHTVLVTMCTQQDLSTEGIVESPTHNHNSMLIVLTNIA